MLRPSYLVALCFLVVSFLQVTAQSQPQPAQQVKTTSPDGPCAMPTLPATSRAPNIFSDQQEEWLGDVIDQTFRKNFQVVEDPDGYLQKLGERLLAQLPPTKMHYRFFIVDAPERRAAAFISSAGSSLLRRMKTNWPPCWGMRSATSARTRPRLIFPNGFKS